MTSLVLLFVRSLCLYGLLLFGAVFTLSGALAAAEGRSVDPAAVAGFAPLVGALASWAAERQLARDGVFRAWAICGGGNGLWRMAVVSVWVPTMASAAWWAQPETSVWWSPVPGGWLVEANGHVLGQIDGHFCRADQGLGPPCPPVDGPRLAVAPHRRWLPASALGLAAALVVAQPGRPAWLILFGLVVAGAAVVLAV